MKEVVSLSFEIAELKLKKEALVSENEKLKRELALEKHRAAIAVDFSMAASTAVKVKKEQNAQMNRQVQELNEQPRPHCLWPHLLSCCIGSIASSTAAQRTCGVPRAQPDHLQVFV